jgi:hypothetical protein
MSNVALSLELQSPEEKVGFSSNLNTQMPLHAADFPGLTAVLNALTPKRDALSDALAAQLAAETQLALARAMVRVADAEHDLQLKVTATYAEQVTMFNGPKLESGGFTLEKVPTPIGPLPAPIDLRSKAGAMPGTTELSCRRVVGGKAYVGECASSPTGPWVQVYSGTKARFTATGLTSGGLYYFRMAVIGTAGQSPWSDISEKRAP